MIAKTIKNTGSGSVANSVDYAQRQGAHKERDKNLSPELKPQVVLLNNLTYSDAKNVSQEFKIVNGFNKNIAENKKHIHEVVSFSTKDIQKLDSPEKRAEATEKYLEHKGISKENFQYIVLEHKDTENVHHHIIHNRVGLDGEVYKASANYERSAVAQERTEKEFNLDNGIERKVIYAPEESRGYIKNPNYGKVEGIVKTPKNRRINDEREKERILTDKQKRIIIQKEIKNSLSQSDVSDMNKLKISLYEKGISVEERYNNDQKLTGVKFIYKEHNATGTQVGYKANMISSKLEENKISAEIVKFFDKNVQIEKPKTEEKVQKIREERFKEADIQINLEVDKLLKSGGSPNYGNDIDPILRKEIAKEFPNENVWAVIDKYGGEKYEVKLNDKVEKAIEELNGKRDLDQNSKELKEANQEYNREHEKPKTFPKFSSESAEIIDNILEKDSSEITNLKLELRGNIVMVLDKLESYRADKEMIWDTFSKMIMFLDSGRKFSEYDLKGMNKVAEKEIESIKELEENQEREENVRRGGFKH